MPASSAPQRSQYHSVGRLSVPHSPHLSVLATPGAPVLAPADGAGGAGAGAGAVSTERGADAPGWDTPGLLVLREVVAGLRSSSATDLRNASSSTGATGSGWRGGGA